MIESNPRWTFLSQRPLNQWHGHVQLLPEQALGQWCCVTRDTGTPLWERTLERPNTIATETVFRGVATASEGCYGISLATGEVIWTSHDDDGQDSPTVVRGDEVVCRSGRVVATRDGSLLRRVTREEIRAAEHQWVESQREKLALYSGRPWRPPGVMLEGIGRVSLRRRSPGPPPRDVFHLAATDDAGNAVWSFDLASTGYVINHFNYYASRLVGRYVYVVAAEGPNSRRAPAPIYAEPIPTTFHLLTIELQRGTIAQDIPLSDHPVTQCRIEDADDRALLISTEAREIKYHARLAGSVA
jgi:hypothetical protein